MEGRLFSSAVDLVHSFRPPASEVNTRCPAPCRLPAAHSWPGNPWESHMQGSPKHFHCPPALIFAPVGLAVHPPQGHKTQRLGCWQVGSADRDTGFRAGDVPGTRIQWWSWGLTSGLHPRLRGGRGAGAGQNRPILCMHPHPSTLIFRATPRWIKGEEGGGATDD